MCLFMIQTHRLSIHWSILKNPASPLSFLLVDKIIELSDKHIVGIKMLLSMNGFSGSLSGNPVMPGCCRLKRLHKPAVYCV